jgi:hypothetical protein
MVDVVWLFGIVVVAILAYCGVDLVSERKQISNMIGALLLVVLGTTFILMAIGLWMQVAVQFVSIGGKEYIAILTEDFSKILGAVGLGTAGMAIITGGFSLIAGGKYEVKVSSTEPLSGVEIKK